MWEGAYSWNAGGATRPGATSPVPWLTLQQLCPHSAPGSQRPTCGLAFTRNTCPQQLPKAEELFEPPYPVWELFQMKSATLPCIKTIFFKERKKKKGDQQGVWFPRSSHAQLSPCPASQAPLPVSSLPLWAAGASETLPTDCPCPGMVPARGPCLPAWTWQSFMPAFLSLLFLSHSPCISFSFSYTSLCLHDKGTPFFF